MCAIFVVMNTNFTLFSAHWLALSPLFLVACGAPMPSGDSGTNADVRVSDSGSMGTPDSGARADSGAMMGNDPCAAERPMALAGAGCNGFVTQEPAANAAGGTCTVDPMSDQGSCTTPTDICDSAMNAMTGRCAASCMPGAGYASTGGCAAGYRCFHDQMGPGGTCFRDCNAAHACPMDMMCDGDGSCVFP